MNGASNGASYWRSTRGNIPDGNLYVVSVTDVCSAIYGERITVQAFRVVLHNLIPGNDGGWNESFLDWLMGTINIIHWRTSPSIQVLQSCQGTSC